MLRALFPLGVCLVVLSPYSRCTCEKSPGLAATPSASPAPGSTVPPPENDGGDCWYEPGTSLCVVQLCSDSYSFCALSEDCYEGLSTPCGTEADASARNDRSGAGENAAALDAGSADATDAAGPADGADADAFETSAPADADAFETSAPADADDADAAD